MSRRDIRAHLAFNARFVAFVAQNGDFVANASLGEVAHARFPDKVYQLRWTRRTTTVSNAAPKETNYPLLHFHVCIHCGSAFRREEVEGRVHTTGLFLCPKCGMEGPLNIEIHEVGNDDSQIVKAQ
jgi:predicted RNA-binding Zn-ribbon protein involved in translation (DUF1610 family)